MQETYVDRQINFLTVIPEKWDIQSIRIYDESAIAFNKLNKEWKKKHFHFQIEIQKKNLIVVIWFLINRLIFLMMFLSFSTKGKHFKYLFLYIHFADFIL